MALTDCDLVAIAESDRTGSDQLMKIAARPQLSEAVTDALLKRATGAIQLKLVENPNARVSEAGFARMIMGLNGDKVLAQAISMRPDVPQELRLWLSAALTS